MGLNMSYTSKVILFVVLVLIGVVFLAVGLHSGEKAEEDALDKKDKEDFAELRKAEKKVCKKREKRLNKIVEADREEQKRKGIAKKQDVCPWEAPSESHV
ncbi:hypothetical protein FIE12Z_5174 [Fusarium flagelliforme]|uniref:Uncharacterized protein n=2 Tax=Fusarium flagelliforme TaxID=2675880 RepID=A0A395MRF0_9HYPO|nr:hypothetical protein FIE12Z_5174 [Fusarium flagelliforme]